MYGKKHFFCVIRPCEIWKHEAQKIKVTQFPEQAVKMHVQQFFQGYMSEEGPQNSQPSSPGLWRRTVRNLNTVCACVGGVVTLSERNTLAWYVSCVRLLDSHLFLNYSGTGGDTLELSLAEKKGFILAW